jgi:hypothetical protein
VWQESATTCINNQYLSIIDIWEHCTDILLSTSVYYQYLRMPRGKSKLKTAIIQLRVEPSLKAAAEQAADKDHRNLTNWIEVLILKRCEELNVVTTPNSPEKQ